MPHAFALSLSLFLYWEIQRATGNERKWWNAEEEYLFELNEHNLPFIEYEETQYRNFKGTFFLFPSTWKRIFEFQVTNLWISIYTENVQKKIKTIIFSERICCFFF